LSFSDISKRRDRREFYIYYSSDKTEQDLGGERGV